MCTSARRRRVVALAVALSVGLASAATAKTDQESKQLRRLESSDAAFTRAVAAQRRGDFVSAAQGYESAIRADSGFVEAMVNLARVEIARGRLDAAAEWVDRAETLRRDYPGVHAARGLLAFHRGDFAVAVDALPAARELAPHDVAVLVNLGAVLLERGFAHEAIDVCLEAQRLDAGRAETQLNLGLAHDRIGETQAAQYHYQRFLDQSSDDDPSRIQVEERLAVLGDVRARPLARRSPFDSRVGRSQSVRGGEER